MENYYGYTENWEHKDFEKPAKDTMRKFKDFLIIAIAGTAAVLFFFIAGPLMFLEKKLYGTIHLQTWLLKGIDLKDAQPFASIYNEPEITGDRSLIYTLQMYNDSQLPPFYFTAKIAAQGGLMPFQKAEEYPTYAYQYETLIDLLNRGILTTNPEQ